MTNEILALWSLISSFFQGTVVETTVAQKLNQGIPGNWV